MIPKEDALFKTRPKPKVNVQLRWISLFSKSSWIKTTASGLSYELGINGENGNWDIINKNGHSTFHTAKPENFNIFGEVIWIILWNCWGLYIKYIGGGSRGFLWGPWNILGIYWWVMKYFSKVLMGHQIFSYVLFS